MAFTVTDRGPGIPAAEADRIFDRFVKLDPFSQGMGLGLAVCRLIADALGGGSNSTLPTRKGRVSRSRFQSFKH
ncbi:MAG: sensor histidine kinase [Alistipes sp.]